MNRCRPQHPTLLPLVDVCDVLGIHRNTGYLLRRRGAFPVPVIEVERRYFCDLADVDELVSPTS